VKGERYVIVGGLDLIRVNNTTDNNTADVVQTCEVAVTLVM